MSLINCPECNHSISTSAKSCPKCGGTKKHKWLILLNEEKGEYLAVNIPKTGLPKGQLKDLEQSGFQVRTSIYAKTAQEAVTKGENKDLFLKITVGLGAMAILWASIYLLRYV